MRLSLTSLWLALLWFANCAFASSLHVNAPQSSTAVMIDGKLSTEEWKDAARIEVPAIANLYFKQVDGFVYISVEYTGSPSGIVDLYLHPETDIFMTCMLPPSSASVNCKTAAGRIGPGGTIALGWLMSRVWIRGKSERFSPSPFANIRSAVRNFLGSIGGCASS